MAIRAANTEGLPRPGALPSSAVVAEMEGTGEAIINKEYLFKNKISRNKLKKNRRLVGRDTMEVFSANEQAIMRHL